MRVSVRAFPERINDLKGKTCLEHGWQWHPMGWVPDLMKKEKEAGWGEASCVAAFTSSGFLTISVM